MIDRWTRADLVGTRIYHLLDLTVGGRVYRFSTTSLSITNEDGDVLRYAPALNPPQFQEDLDGREPSVAIQIVSPEINWAQKIIGEGHDITAATASLSQWREGLNYEQRRLLIKGRADDANFGALGEALSFSIVLDGVDDKALICDSDRAVNETTWPILETNHITVDYEKIIDIGGSDQRAQGQSSFPINFATVLGGQLSRVFGVPGSGLLILIKDKVLSTDNVLVTEVDDAIAFATTVVNQFVPGSPGVAVAYLPSTPTPSYFLDTTAADPQIVYTNWVQYYIIIADRRIEAETVYVRNYNQPDVGWISASVVYLTDGLGAALPAVRIGDPDATGYDPADGVIDFDPDGDYWIGWDPDEGGGEFDDLGDKAIAGAGDMLLRLLGESTVDVDYGRTAAAVDYLNGWKIAGYTCDTEQTVFDFIVRELVPILPISLRHGPNGVYPIYLPSEPSKDDALAVFDAANFHIKRQGDISLTGQPINDVTIRYTLDPREDEYRDFVIAHGDPDRIIIADNSANSGTARQIMTHRARVSHARYGRQSLTVETDWINDRTTAELLAAHLVDEKAMPRMEIAYQTGTEWGWLELGSLVVLNDSEIGLVDELAQVQSITWVGDLALTIRFRIMYQLRQR